MPQPISILNKFPTQDIAGPGDPAFDAMWPPKNWKDPNPKQTGRNLSGVPYATYHVYVSYDAAMQSPIFEDVSIPIPFAKVVNIVPNAPGSTYPALLPDCPVPVRDLKDDEVIKSVGMAGIPMVFTATELVVPADPGQDFTADEKALLLNAARKTLGV